MIFFFKENQTDLNYEQEIEREKDKKTINELKNEVEKLSKIKEEYLKLKDESLEVKKKKFFFCLKKCSFFFSWY